jgi:hypothetical protein
MSPPRNPVITWGHSQEARVAADVLDDRDAARLMTAARASADPRDRLRHQGTGGRNPATTEAVESAQLRKTPRDQRRGRGYSPAAQGPSDT